MMRFAAAAVIAGVALFSASSAEARYVQSCTQTWVPDYPTYPTYPSTGMVTNVGGWAPQPVPYYPPPVVYPRYPRVHGHWHGNHVDWYGH